MADKDQKHEAPSATRQSSPSTERPSIGVLKMVNPQSSLIGDLLRLGKSSGVLRALSFLPFAPISATAAVAEELARGMDSKEGISVGALVATAAIGVLPFGRLAHRVGLDKLFTSGIAGIAGKLEAKLAHDALPALVSKAKVVLDEAIKHSPQLAERLEKNNVSSIIFSADVPKMSLHDFHIFSTAVNRANTTLRTFSIETGRYWKPPTLPGIDPVKEATAHVALLTTAVGKIQKFADEAIRLGKIPLD